MKTKHTPGPWEHKPKSTTVYIGNKLQAIVSAEVGIKDIDWEEAEANARLIAAAPDLLNACKLALRFFSNDSGSNIDICKNYIEQAIQKAEGEK